MATKQDELELGEDLFDFDDVLRDAVRDTDELGAAFDAVLATTGGAPVPAQAAADQELSAADAALLELEPAAPLPAPTHRVRPTPPPLGTVPARPAETPPPVRVAAAQAPVAQTPAAPHAAQRIALSPALLAVLLALVAVNVGLAALVVRAMSAVQSTVVDVGAQVASARAEAPAPIAEPDAVPALAPDADARPEGPAALERAQAQLAAGAFERGRQTLFALLAVIDRVPAEVRGDVEARARFLLADSWRLEADALARGTEAGR